MGTLCHVMIFELLCYAIIDPAAPNHYCYMINATQGNSQNARNSQNKTKCNNKKMQLKFLENVTAGLLMAGESVMTGEM